MASLHRRTAPGWGRHRTGGVPRHADAVSRRHKPGVSDPEPPAERRGDCLPGAGSGGEAYSHDSDEECIIVLKDRPRFCVGEELFDLDEKDSLTFESRLPHRNTNAE